ncbi:MAG: hypothetical protein Q9214_006340, partial [Letrouitia sp. 1 TL-2023]
MKPTEFAAAQDRVTLQRSLHNDKRQTHLSTRSSQPVLQLTSRLLYPLNILSRGGIELWDTVKGKGGTRPANRVGQVDAELLDEELLELLRGQVQQGLKHFGVHSLSHSTRARLANCYQSRICDEWSLEILLCLRAILFKLSIWDHNASYGAALQNLKYVDARRHGPVATSPSRWQKACHGVCSVGGRYAWTKWEEWLTEAQGFYNE